MAKTQEILTSKHKDFLNLITKQKELSDIFYLSGGTALAAYYLHHRYSDDLDFFTNCDDFDWDKIFQFIELAKKELNAKEVIYNKLYDRRIFYLKFTDNSELKVEFTYYPFLRLEKPQIIDGIKIDSLTDIAANKFFTIIERVEIKDYTDLYFISKKYSFNKLQKLAEKKFGVKIDPITIGSKLVLVKKFTILPKMIKKITMDKLVKFYLNEASKLKTNLFY